MDSKEIQLYNDPFFLHTFADEYIGNGIGNDIERTVNSFVECLPDQTKKKFELAIKYEERLNHTIKFDGSEGKKTKAEGQKTKTEGKEAEGYFAIRNFVNRIKTLDQEPDNRKTSQEIEEYEKAKS